LYQTQFSHTPFPEVQFEQIYLEYIMDLIRRESATLLIIATLIFFLIFGAQFSPQNISFAFSMLLLSVLFLIMLWAAFGVVRHAECLALILGNHMAP